MQKRERERVKHPAVNIEKKITVVNSFRTSSNNCKKTFLCVLWCPIGKEQTVIFPLRQIGLSQQQQQHRRGREMAFFIPSNQNWSQQFFPFNSSTKKKNRVFLCFQRKARMYYVDLCKIVLRCNFLSQKSFGLELENVAPRFNINSKLIVIMAFSSAPPHELNLYLSFLNPKQTLLVFHPSSQIKL